LRLRTPDLPGQLKRIVEVLAEQGSNIVDVQHYRAGWRVPLGFVDIDVLIETRKRGEGELVERALQARGITLRT
jgi:ACT domain-containing protein